jgi:3-deoxy-manno-octulosonate cytidylyltransferase (CMP-KDO synthetase)
VQGDEPLMNPQDILDIIKAAEKYTGEIINGYAPINEEDYQNLTVPKVVIRPDGRLLYMSRSPIPGNKNGSFQKAWRQVCVYAFPKIALQTFISECKKTPLEAQEDIEILRFLELGYEVRMIPLSVDSIAVDVPEDVERVKQKLKEIE